MGIKCHQLMIHSNTNLYNNATSLYYLVDILVLILMVITVNVVAAAGKPLKKPLLHYSLIKVYVCVDEKRINYNVLYYSW